MLLVGCFAACGSSDDPGISQNEFATNSGDDAAPVALDVPDGYVRFATIDDDNVVTVLGLYYLRNSINQTVAVSEQSTVTANVSELDGAGAISSVTVDGSSIPVQLVESDSVNYLYAPEGDSKEDASTIDLTSLGNLASAGTTKPGTTTTKPATLATAAAVKTTKKPDVTKDEYQQAKDEINSNPNLSDKEKREALKLLSYKLDKNGIFYVEHEPWQKQFGFNQIYDLAAPLVQMVYATIRVKFRYGYVYKLYTEGDNKGKVIYDAAGNPTYETDSNGKPIEKDWMIQLWKGRYGLVMLGGEIGVYTKPSTQSSEHYYSAVAEEELVMAMDLYQHNFTTKKTEHLFTRGPESNWWLTGFVPGSYIEYNNKKEIILVANMQFPTEEMMKLFANGMKAAGFSEGNPGRDNPETYKMSGTSLKFSWQYIDQDG